MTHMVVFRSTDGKPGYHQAEGLDEAVRFVEHLRNTEQVSDGRIFRMQEVPIEFKTYYRVEVAGAAAEEPVAPAPASADQVADPLGGEGQVTGEPVPAGNGAGRFGLFGRT